MFSFYQSYESTNLIGEAQNVCDAAIKHKDIEIIQLIVSELGWASEWGIHINTHSTHYLHYINFWLLFLIQARAAHTHTQTHTHIIHQLLQQHRTARRVYKSKYKCVFAQFPYSTQKTHTQDLIRIVYACVKETCLPIIIIIHICIWNNICVFFFVV